MQIFFSFFALFMIFMYDFIIVSDLAMNSNNDIKLQNGSSSSSLSLSVTFYSRHHKTTTKNTLLPNLSFCFILSFVKHQYHAKIDDQIDKALASMTQGLINKLVSVLEATLGKLGRYDEGSLIGSLLSFTVALTKRSNKNQLLNFLNQSL